jgi:hypothetical protein
LPCSFDAFVFALNLTNAGSFSDGAVVCSEHFAEEAYVEGELRRVASSTQVLTKPPRAPRLRDDAMPTLNIHVNIPESLSPSPSTASKPRKRKSYNKNKGATKIRRSRLTQSEYTRRERERSNTPQPGTSNEGTYTSTPKKGADEPSFPDLDTTTSTIPIDPLDTTWKPEVDDFVEEDEEDREDENEEDDSTEDEKKTSSFVMFLIYFSSLLELFNFCSKCGAKILFKNVSRIVYVNSLMIVEKSMYSGTNEM